MWSEARKGMMDAHWSSGRSVVSVEGETEITSGRVGDGACACAYVCVCVCLQNTEEIRDSSFVFYGDGKHDKYSCTMHTRGFKSQGDGGEPHFLFSERESACTLHTSEKKRACYLFVGANQYKNSPQITMYNTRSHTVPSIRVRREATLTFAFSPERIFVCIPMAPLLQASSCSSRTGDGHCGQNKLWTG